MDEPQVIKTPNGDELVVLNRQDYDALLEALAEAEEDLADIATLDRCRAELAAANVPNLPPELTPLLHRGMARLTAIRTWRAMDQATLAARVGLKADVLADIEANRLVLAGDLCSKLASALNVPPEWIAS